MQNLIVRVTNAYFNVLSAQDTYDFQVAQKRAIKRQLEQTKQRFAVGLIAITGVHEAQAQYDLANATEIQANNALTNSYEALSEITGRQYTSIDILNEKRFSPVLPSPSNSQEWVTMAEQSSVELMTQRIAKDIAQEKISLYQAGHMPSLSLNAGYNTRFEQEPDPQATANFDNATLGINLNVPIFQGFKVSSQVKQAQYQYVEASEKLEQTHRSVVKNIRNNFNNVSSSISSIKAYEQSVISSESALKATEASFEVGTRTIVDVLDSTQQLYNSKRQLSDAKYNYIESVFALKLAAGTLNEQDLVAINNGLIAPATTTK